MTVNPDTRYCPSCGADWQAGEIPEEKRKYYGGKTHFGRLIGIYDIYKDMTVAWRCPDCREEWPR